LPKGVTSRRGSNRSSFQKRFAQGSDRSERGGNIMNYDKSSARFPIYGAFPYFISPTFLV
jgi:hypothetical protein